MATVRRTYGDFRGVDLRGQEVSLQRSPDSRNMWRDYKTLSSIRTRPGLRPVQGFSQPVYGIYGQEEALLLHSGDGLYRLQQGQPQLLGSGLRQGKSCGFSYGQSWYFLDGAQYWRYDGTALAPVQGHIPTTVIGRAPQGGGTPLEDANLLTDLRINAFQADGQARVFTLDQAPISPEYPPQVQVDGVATPVTQVDWQAGKVTLAAPPPAATQGRDNVTVCFQVAHTGNREKIAGCTLAQVFDNRVFVSGNPRYPNTLWHSSLDQPGYFSQADYYREGLDETPITAMTVGSNALWVFRAGTQGGAVFYHTPALDPDYGKIYPGTHAGVTAGCVGAAANFLGDTVFFSPRGMESLRLSQNAVQLCHRSALVDRQLLAEPAYGQLLLQVWEGYLLIFAGRQVYLADSRQSFSHEGHREYEFFCWSLEQSPLSVAAPGQRLYLGMADGLYTLSREAGPVESWWTTPPDRFGQPGRWKTLDGRPALAEATGQLSISIRGGPREPWRSVFHLSRVEDAAVFRPRKRKFKDLQLRFSSPSGFSLETVTLETQTGTPIRWVPGK